MGTDALSDYQRLGAKLEAAAAQLEARRIRRKSSKALHVPDLAGHPAEPLPEGTLPPPLDATFSPDDELRPSTPQGSEREFESTDMPDGQVSPVVAAEDPAGTADVDDVSATLDQPEPTRSAGPTDPGKLSTDSDEAARPADLGSPVPTDSDSNQTPGSDVDLRAVEALLFSTRHPLTPARLGELLGGVGVRQLRVAVARLNEQYERTGRCFRVEQVAGGYQLLTLPEFGPLLNKLHQREADSKLTRAAIETLAIIAYKQPVLRAEVEAIRGVASGETIRSLMEKHLVKIAGRADEPGRPILYGTTRRFLELFGLNSLKDLPKDAVTEGSASSGVGKTDAAAVTQSTESRQLIVAAAEHGPAEVKL